MNMAKEMSYKEGEKFSSISGQKRSTPKIKKKMIR